MSRDFDPKRLGYFTLKELLADLPELGELSVSPGGHPQFAFARLGHQELDHTNPMDQATPEFLKLKSAFWHAITAFSRGERQPQFDLAALRVVSHEDGTEKLMERFPERFLSLPDAGAQFQKALAIEFFCTELDVGDSEAQALADGPDWFAQVTERVGVMGVEGRWREFRQAAIVGLALDWARQHSIDFRKIADPLPGKRHSDDSAPPGPSSPDLRQNLHRLIDSLSDEELRHISIPAWILFRQWPRPHSRNFTFDQWTQMKRMADEL